MHAFQIKGSITQLRGEVFKVLNDKDAFVTLHPSFINRQPSYKQKFEDDMQKVSIKMGLQKEEQVVVQMSNKTGVHYYKIPDKFYTLDYRLVDVQFLKNNRQTLYIFRDKDNNKVYHKENDNYVCYQIPEGMFAKKLINYNDLKQVSIPYGKKTMLKTDITYEGDYKITTKHSQDYYLQSKEEPPETNLNVMFLDIEIYSEKKEFPDIEEAGDAIVMITYWFNGMFKSYILDNRTLLKDNKLEAIKESDEIIIFKNERDLISKFIKDVRDLEPDYIAGWNVVRFDMSYIYYRGKKLGIPLTLMSKFQEVEADLKQGYVDIAGMNVIDQLTLYKSFSESLKENYRLGTIAQIELGETKMDVGASFSEKYIKDINGAIEYNRRDVILLVKLENKLKHIALQNEIRRVCRCSFRSSMGTLASLDSLVTSFLKGKGVSSKNADIHEGDEKFEGAFVKIPMVGIHEHVVDLDFTSLYPSLIQTYNIGVNTFVMKFEDFRLGYDFAYQSEKLPDKIKVVIDPIYSNHSREVSKEDLLKKVKDGNLICTINGCFYLPHDKEVSIYSEVLDLIMGSRKKYKKVALDREEELTKLKKDNGDEKKLKEIESERDLNDNRQKVYKILANSIYGVLGNHVFRFFNTDNARSVTLSGQEMIKASIIEADKYVDFIKTKKHERPNPVTKEDMYVEEMNRETKNIITGDTDSLFITYENVKENVTIKDMDEWNKRIQNFLNKELVPELIKRHNVDVKNSRLELKNELLINRGLFLAKKRYALHVIRREGKMIDEVQVKGLETRRSDYPSYSKECIKELLNLILKSEKVPLKKIMDFVKSKESDFLEKIKSGNKEVARPCSWTKKLSEYKVLSQGVRAMQNWNQIMYNIHSIGSKGYLFKLKGIDLEKAPKDVVDRYNKEFLEKGRKLEVIAIPDEEEKLPDYFIPDVKEMLEFSWISRYSLILDPLTQVKESDKVLTF